MKEELKQHPDITSVQIALTNSWQEHQHTRDQTWKALQIVLFVSFSIIFTQSQLNNRYITALTLFLVILSCLSGISVTLHHRKYQRKKFEQISRFEKELNLKNLIGEVSEPKAVKLHDFFSALSQGNTPMFIIRTYIIVIIICAAYSGSIFFN